MCWGAPAPAQKLSSFEYKNCSTFFFIGAELFEQLHSKELNYSNSSRSERQLFEQLRSKELN
jgi:hypothetical protein